MPANKSPRVAIIGSGWLFTSGISYYTCRLATALSAEHSVSAVLMRRLIPRRFYPGRSRVGVELNDVTYPESMPVYNGVDWFWIPSLVGGIRALRRAEPDVAIFQWWTGAVLHSYLALALAARLSGAKLVIEFHETQDTGEQQLRGAARYLKLVGGLVVRLSHGFIVHSDFDRAAVSAGFPVSGKPIKIIPHGPYDHHVTGDEDPQPSSPSVAGQASAVAEDQVTVLFFGTIRPYKGLEHLVEAFDGLDDQAAARLRLLIVGETWEDWTGPLAAARASRHADRIEIVNRYVHDEEVGPIFESADLVVLPYTRSSASGPLHIAMAHGLPVLITSVGGLRESAGDYQGVSWVEPNDPAGITQHLLKATKRSDARFDDPRSWDESTRLYDELFAELAL